MLKKKLKENRLLVFFLLIIVVLLGILVGQNLFQQQRIGEEMSNVETKLSNIENRIISMEDGLKTVEKFALRDTITLSVSNRNWYPFSFPGEDKMSGMHIDIVTDALENLGYNVELESYPTMRVINQAQEGKSDGVISIAYDSNLENLEFPSDAGGEEAVDLRIMQVDQVLVTHVESNYSFDGDLATIPEPARAIYGEEQITNELENLNIEISEARSAETNFSQLIRDKKGSVITTPIMAENLNSDPDYGDKINIHAQPLTSLSYHLAFSSGADLSEDQKDEIWEEIASLREDYLYMIPLFVKYD